MHHPTSPPRPDNNPWGSYPLDPFEVSAPRGNLSTNRMASLPGMQGNQGNTRHSYRQIHEHEGSNIEYEAVSQPLSLNRSWAPAPGMVDLDSSPEPVSNHASSSHSSSSKRVSFANPEQSPGKFLSIHLIYTS